MYRQNLHQFGCVAAAALCLFSLSCSSIEKKVEEHTANPNKGSLFGLLPDSPVRPLLSPGFEFRITNPVDVVRNVPEGLRYVPVHRDDSRTLEPLNGPIPDSSIRPALLWEIRFIKLGIEANPAEFLTLSAFGDCSFNLSYFHIAFRELNERNYTDAPGTHHRGVGAALTCYGSNYRPMFIPGVGAEVRFNLAEMEESTTEIEGIEKSHTPEYICLLLGASYREYQLRILDGWDRHSGWEQHRSHTIADISETSLYGGFAVTDMTRRLQTGIRVGVCLNEIDNRYKSLGMRINGNPVSYFIGIGGFYNF